MKQNELTIFLQITAKQISKASNQLNQYVEKFNKRLKAKNLFYVKQLAYVLRNLMNIFIEKTSPKSSGNKAGWLVCVAELDQYFFDPFFTAWQIVKPPTQRVVRGYWWKPINGGRLCGDRVSTLWVVWQWSLTFPGSAGFCWSLMVPLRHVPCPLNATNHYLLANADILNVGISYSVICF